MAKLQLLRLVKSHRPEKKIDAVFRLPSGRTKVVSFGASGYEDYTMHKDPERRRRYIERHQVRENWDDPTKPGTLALWILWGPSTTISANLRAFRREFGV